MTGNNFVVMTIVTQRGVLLAVAGDPKSVPLLRSRNRFSLANALVPEVVTLVSLLRDRRILNRKKLNVVIEHGKVEDI